MTLTIKINMDNAAFGETDEERGQEIERILHRLSRIAISEGISKGEAINIRDLNGNHVGQLTTTRR